MDHAISVIQKLGAIASTLVVLIMPVYADEPVEGVRHTFENSNNQWQMDRNGGLILSFYEEQSLWTRYDISACSFCTGADDNCDMDGIVEINLASRPNEPVLAVTCHVGAHSQRLQVFAPSQNQTDAVYTVTGEYYITFTQGAENIRISYDKRRDDGTFGEVVTSWP